jgi:hypothetical protein
MWGTRLLLPVQKPVISLLTRHSESTARHDTREAFFRPGAT